MKKALLSALLLFLICLRPAFAQGGYAEGEVLAVIDAPVYEYYENSVYSKSSYSEAVSSMAASFAKSAGLTALSTFSEISEISGTHITHLRSETKSTEQLMRELANDPRVKSVSPNYIKYVTAIEPNDPDYDKLWGMKMIRMPEVWSRVTGSGEICVAVLDSGIDYNHEDIKDNMAVDSYGNPGRRFSGDGTVNGNPMDSFGHGTHVAGIIGAVGNNGIGVAGVNWRVKLLAVNVLPSGSGYDANIIEGMNYILSEKNKGLNIRVVNMSFGGWEKLQPDDSPFGKALKALSDAGIICVLAAGNESQNISNIDEKYAGKLIYPACFRFANTITVGSIGNNDAKSSFSNYSDKWVHIAAPGANIYSTLPTNHRDGKYGNMSGTSMAVPHVSGTAAILYAAFPNETSAQIRYRILNGARNKGVSEGYWENGILDAAGAYAVVPAGETNRRMTSVKITGEKIITAGLYTLLNSEKNPSNANGNFEYSWESGNLSIAEIYLKNYSSAEIAGLSEGQTTITLTVTQTLPSGEKITKRDSFDIIVTEEFYIKSSGCNSGLFFIALLFVLSILKTRD